jgi:lysophospholipase L1-like esterase
MNVLAGARAAVSGWRLQRATVTRTRGDRTARLVLGAFLLGFLITAACGGSGSPGPGPDPTLTVSCPADLQVAKHAGTPATATFDTPAAQGGRPPTTVTCTPASGSEFPVGSSPVTCNASDQASHTASCSFSVTVDAIPRIAVTKFLAFGDSITQGTTSPAPSLLILNLEDAYPLKLQRLLSARYLDQTIVMTNAGKAGERIDDGRARLSGVLNANQPQVLLLLHGANDLNIRRSDAFSTIIHGLEDMIGKADRRGIKVFLATFPPQNPAGKNGNGANYVPELNRRIRALAADEGATLVDLYAGFGGTWVGYIGVDGLHPTPQGYDRMAEIWRDAIQQVYDRPAPAGQETVTMTFIGPRR